MPQAPPRACRSGCPHLLPCPIHAKKRWADRQGSRQARGYGARHAQLRQQLLRERPICELCGIRPSSVADHRIPLARGGQTVRSNYQALCKSCSKTKSAKEGARVRQFRATSAFRLQATAKGGALASPASGRAEFSTGIPPGGRP